MEQQPTKNNNYIVWILGILCTVSPFAIDMYLPAFKQIAADFNTTPAQISFSVSSYFIGMAIGQLIYGPLLDRYGRKKPLYAGLGIYLVACVACSMAPNTTSLIIIRFIQALGGAAAVVGSMAMVRDFFPVNKAANVFSMLVLVIGVSPLLAPTVGGFVAVEFGWRAVFIALAIIVSLILLLIIFVLPEGHKPDPEVSLKPGPMFRTFGEVIKEPVFYTHVFAQAFAFSTIFIYVAGSPIIFLEILGVGEKEYGLLFGLLSISFIGTSQLNILLTKRFKSQVLFRFALLGLTTSGIVFALLVYANVLGLYGVVAMFFICLGFIGLINPNGSAISLSPFTKNIGSASALMACTQIGVAAIMSSCIGMLDAKRMFPIILLISASSVVASAIYFIGNRQIKKQGKTITI